MPRFFFDFRQGHQRTPDVLGTEFLSVEEAYLGVFKAGQEMWSELFKQRQDPRRCSFEVRSEGGDVLFTFPLQEVLECCTDSRAKPEIRAPATGPRAELQATIKEARELNAYAARVRSEHTRQMQISRQALREAKSILRGAWDRLWLTSRPSPAVTGEAAPAVR